MGGVVAHAEGGKDGGDVCGSDVLGGCDRQAVAQVRDHGADRDFAEPEDLKRHDEGVVCPCPSHVLLHA